MIGGGFGHFGGIGHSFGGRGPGAAPAGISQLKAGTAEHFAQTSVSAGQALANGFAEGVNSATAFVTQMASRHRRGANFSP